MDQVDRLLGIYIYRYSNKCHNLDTRGGMKMEAKVTEAELRKMVRDGADLSNLDVSSVRDMSWMFHRSAFNGDISGWDVSRVKNMRGMFAHSAFTGDISGWDVSRVKNMRGVFAHSAFKGGISGWDVSRVKNMRGMFYQ